MGKSAQGFVLRDSAEFNAALWAARADGNEELAEELLSVATWENAGDGRMTRRAELSVIQSDEVVRLIGGVTAGEITIHPVHREGVERLLGRILQSQTYFDLRRAQRNNPGQLRFI